MTREPLPRRAAESALAHSGLAGARLALLAHRGSTLYRVDAPPSSADAGARRFVLRVYGRRPPPREQIVSELTWLLALRRDAGLAVPEPVPVGSGELLCTAPSSGEDEPRLCVLTRWVEGRFYSPSSLRPAMLRQLGGLMAALHDHAAGFEPPAGFSRPRWDWRAGFAPTAPIYQERNLPLVPPAARDVFAATAARIELEIQAIEQGPGTYGLIHSDLQHTNYLFHRGAARAIDFGDCQWGYYLFDMAVTLFDVTDRPDEAALRDAFFGGYTALRSLPADFEARLKPFTAARLVRRANYLLGGADPKQTGLAREWIARTVAWLRAYLDG